MLVSQLKSLGRRRNEEAGDNPGNEDDDEGYFDFRYEQQHLFCN